MSLSILVNILRLKNKSILSLSVTLTDDQSASMLGFSQSISQTAQDGSDSDLMEAAVEEFFDFWPFEGDRLELSFVVVVEERQSLSSVCGKAHKLHVNTKTRK